MRKLFYIIIMLIGHSALFPDDMQSGHFLYFPKEYADWQLQSSAGISMTILPRSVAEEEIRQIPLIDYHLRFGLPYDVSASARLSSVYISNQAALGLQWSYSYGMLSASAGDKHAYWYGSADLEGFDVEASGWINYPFVSFGVNLDDVLISLSAEMIIIASQKTTVGGTTLRSSKNDRAGYSFTFALEQPFWKNNYLLMALKLNYAKTLYQSWLAFTTFEEKLMYPEFIVGFIF